MDIWTIPAMKHCWGSQGSCQMASLSHNELNRCWPDPNLQSLVKFESNLKICFNKMYFECQNKDYTIQVSIYETEESQL